jgi:ribonuclease BN (tRNA processing enzyme)
MTLFACNVPEATNAAANTGPERASDSRTPASAPTAFPIYDGTTRVVLLGTGTPVNDPERQGPATAIVVDDVPYLVDMGPGVVRQAAKAEQRGIVGLESERLDRVFVTHLHSDHTVGFPDLLLSPWVMGRRQPLEVFGPPGIAEMSQKLRAAYAADIQKRTSGMETLEPIGASINAHEVDAPGRIYEDSRVKVDAISVLHGSWTHAYGYRFETKDRVVVVSGDTSASNAIARACDGCDVLVHEVYWSRGLASLRNPDVMAYHQSHHTSGADLGKLAAKAKPKLLVLTHQLFTSSDHEPLLQEVRQHYDGPIVSGNDLDVF